MDLTWIHESPAQWDQPKQIIVGGAPEGALHVGRFAIGDLVPGEWWRVEAADRIVGYGWMDHSWGDAEILLAVHPERQHGGVGTFILDHLEREAAALGVNYIYNEVAERHPDADRVERWLRSRRFKPSAEGRLLKRAVRRAEAG